MHYEPLKKHDAQVVEFQGAVQFLFLLSLSPAGRGWFAKKSLQTTRDGRSSHLFALAGRRRGSFGTLGGIEFFATTTQNRKEIHEKGRSEKLWQTG
jgi:hypothetical protein